MSLTPLDVEKATFRRGFFGYNQQEVNHLLDDVSRSLEQYLAQIAQQQARITQLEAEVARHQESEQLLRTNAALTQRAADELVTAARERATGIKREAELEAEAIKHGLSNLRREREQFEYTFHSLLAGFLRRLEAANPALRGAASDAGQAIDARTASPNEPTFEAPASLTIDAVGQVNTRIAPKPASATVAPPAESPRISLQPGLAPRQEHLPEPNRAELLDMLAGPSPMQNFGPDSDADELARILSGTQSAGHAAPLSAVNFTPDEAHS